MLISSSVGTGNQSSGFDAFRVRSSILAAAGTACSKKVPAKDLAKGVTRATFAVTSESYAHMTPFTKPAGLFILIGLFTACVPARKYEELQTRYKGTQESEAAALAKAQAAEAAVRNRPPAWWTW